MKKSILTATVILVASTTSIYATALGVFGSYWDTSDGDSSFGFGGSAHMESLPLEMMVSMYPDLSIRDGGTTTVIPVDVGFAANLTRAEAFDVYVGGGASYYFIDTDNGNPDNQWGYYTMARLEIPVKDRMNVFGEAMYRGVEFEDVNADLAGPAISFGVIFR